MSAVQAHGSARPILHFSRDEYRTREIEYHCHAARLADDALEAALATTTASACEGDILAAMQGAAVEVV